MKGITRPDCVISALLVACLSTGMGSFACAASTPPSPATAPDFTITQCVKADTLRLSDFREHPVLLFFFDAGHMGDMRAYPYVREWNRRYRGDGLRILGIHCPLFEPLKVWDNILTALSRADLGFPIGIDIEREVYAVYSIEVLPTFVLLRPGGEIAVTASGPRVYSETETAIQHLLTDLRPEIIHPFLVEPGVPADDPDAKTLRATPMVVLGHTSGAIADLDSSDFGKYKFYADRGGRDKGKAYLNGRWKIDEYSVSHEQEGEDMRDHVRVIYAGKDVWLLAGFEPNQAPRIYVKQDRSYLPEEIWGKDIHVDRKGIPYVRMRYAIPAHIVSNSSYGTHEIQLIMGEGKGALCYLFFGGDLTR